MFKKLFNLLTVTLIFTAIQPVMAADPDPSLQGWWAFDGNALDSSGNDRHGTLIGTPQFVPAPLARPWNLTEMIM